MTTNEQKFEEVLKLYKSEQYAQALPLLEALANDGYAPAQSLYGNYFYNGWEVEKDFNKSAEWYRKAAEQGNVDGQCLFGGCLYFGHGIEQNYAEAVKWFLKAAEQNDEIAQDQLGICFEYGYGVEKDMAKAAEWYRLSAEQGYANGQYHLGLCYFNEVGLELDVDKAIYWTLKAAENGQSEAQFTIGNCCYMGYSTIEKNIPKAIEWWRKSAESGDRDAQNKMGNLYYLGEDIEKDYAKAVDYFSKAAQQGHGEAQFSLGLCYIKGEGVAEDVDKAIEWITRAAEQGHEEAAKIYAKMREKGIIPTSLYKTTFNYVLTHRVIPQMIFGNPDFFYETILPESKNVEVFLQQAVENAAKTIEGNLEIEPPYPIEKFKIFVFGDINNMGGIIIRLPKCEKDLDCFEIAIPFMHRRYFTLELSTNPLNNKRYFTIGEWEIDEKGSTHLNHGPLDIDGKVKFPDRLIQILGGPDAGNDEFETPPACLD